MFDVLFECISAALLASSYLLLCATVLVTIHARSHLVGYVSSPYLSKFLSWSAVVFSSLATLYSLGYEPAAILGIMLIGSVTLLTRLPTFTEFGRLFTVTGVVFIFVTALWTLCFVVDIEVSVSTSVLLILAWICAVISIPSRIVQLIEQYEVLLRTRWSSSPSLASSTIRKTSAQKHPRVALHIPIYSEPPELVIQTLNSISRLNYPNFEVWVIDNNTKERSLWEPVKKHCERLGERFNFIHVPVLRGAKAGALNYLLKHHTAKDVEIIGLIDADYHPRPDFLTALTPHFRDRSVGFVQTPHDYRDWERNVFQRFCYFEYKLFFFTTMLSMDERGAGLTVGTMCLIRREALEKAGRWSEWCVTEDSELAIRIHAAGYSSVYSTEGYGKGLIPDSFAAYKKQRYRWTAGPVQEFMHHYKLLWPWPQLRRSKLDLAQRIHHFNHGLGIILSSTSLLTIMGLLVITSMTYHHEIVQVPFALFASATVILLSNLILLYTLFSVVLRTSFKDFLGARLALAALNHTVARATERTLMYGNARWVRTNKFKQEAEWHTMFRSVRVELLLGIGLLAYVAINFSIMPYHGLHGMFLIGMTYVALSYFAAPIFVLFEARSRTQYARKCISESATSYSITHIGAFYV